MSIYKLKIGTEDNGAKIISILRKFDPSLSIADIRKRIAEDDYIVEYDLLHWDITEQLASVDRISKLRELIQLLEECDADVRIFDERGPIDKTFFENSMQRLREIEQEVIEDMDREAEE